MTAPDPVRTEKARQVARSLLADPSRSSCSPDELAADHPDLMPELGRELRKLATIRRAFAQASSGNLSLDAGAEREADFPALALPGYALVGEIHRGGQGVVYRAIQNTTGREVAIKVLRQGPFAGRHDLERFDQEVRILAGLDHPNIITIHDRGRGSGHDFFVMDYVPGTALDEHVAPPDGTRMDVRATVALWAEVCEAVEAAHQRGVIHRDLKPGNIRVTPDGRPRVLDFGLAKRTDDASDVPAMTRTGQFVGSLPWASPEQAEGRLDALDVRTDVYALGVIGHQLLTGRFPYAIDGPAHEVIERIRTAQPIPVSRGRRECDDELDTIVARCLAKEPARRYQHAGDLARDLRRYLAGDPIEAKRDSTAYVLRKLLARHRLAVGTAAVVALTVLGSAITLFVQNSALRASRQAESDARRTSDQIARFLQDAITAADPYEGQGRDASVGDLLDQAAAQIAFTLDDDPAVRIPVQRTIGTSYVNLGELDEAETHLAAALVASEDHFGPDSLEAARSLHALAEWHRHADQPEQAASLLERARAILADVAPESPERWEVDILLAQVRYDLGDATTANERISAVLTDLAGHDAPAFLPLRGEARNLAGLLALDASSPADATREFELAYDAYLRAYGEAHPATVTALGNLAHAATAGNVFDEALDLYTDALETLDARIGPEHPVTLRVRQNYAALLLRSGDLDEAETIFEALARRDEAGNLGTRARALLNLGVLYQRRGGDDHDQRHANRQASLDAYQQARELLIDLYGRLHPDVATVSFNIATTHALLGDLPAAADRYAEALAIRTEVLADDHPDLNLTRVRLAQTRANLDQHAEAEELALAAAGGYAAGQRIDAAVDALRRVARELLRADETPRVIRLLKRAIALLDSQDDEDSRTLRDQLAQALKTLED